MKANAQLALDLVRCLTSLADSARGVGLSGVYPQSIEVREDCVVICLGEPVKPQSTILHCPASRN